MLEAVKEMPEEDRSLFNEACEDINRLYEKYPKLLKAHTQGLLMAFLRGMF